MSTQDSIHRLASDLRDAIEQIQAEHRRLAERPTLTASGALNEATARRDRLVNELGRVVADALLAGETVSFVAPAEGEATPEPIETAPVVAVAPATYSAGPTRYVARRSAPRRRDPIDTAALEEFIGELEDTEDLDTIQQFDQRYQRLRFVASHPNRWIDLPAKAQRHLIGLTVALLRDLQEANEEFGRPLREPEIVGLVSRLSHWSKEHRPGWVNGMARGAVPDEGEWLADARVHVAELRRMLGDDLLDDETAEEDRYTPTDDEEEDEEDAADAADPIHRPCPACGAQPGERCQTDTGRKLYSYHHKERR